MIFVHAFNVGNVIPYQQPHDDGKTFFDFEPYVLPPISLLRAGWSLCQEARKYLWAKNIVILQGQNTEKLEDLVCNLSEELPQPARKFHVRLSWNDMSGPALSALKSDAITEMKQRGFCPTWSREVRLQHIHDRIRDGLLAFWWSRLALVKGLKLDHLTIDFREATCPEFCCEDLAAKAAWNSPRLLYGLPLELKVVANDATSRPVLRYVQYFSELPFIIIINSISAQIVFSVHGAKAIAWLLGG
ncbi:MAG: hypothetical protein LQ347_002743 [Umbilicaria vellea]|nr:MAG: hypothetical protein LQ347_002743 [Umbilicaria vellea]